ncbi:MAG: hypothetical protein HC905_25990 [Bacteroidales bacterium]|nr:hypothetical protein [Bacteroidales bacterium]
MIELIDFILENKITDKFVIAGYQTEEILQLYKNIPVNIEIKGAISNKELVDLYKNCKAILINQRASSGALTKLIELQIAGVPMIVNDLSLRSYSINSGCKSFHNHLELISILEHFVPEVPEYPNSIEVSEKSVTKKITELLNKEH